MKIEEYVEKIRLKVEDAVKNTLDRCGITATSNDFKDVTIAGIEVGNVKQLIESISEEKHEWIECYEEIVDDYAFTLFNRLVCIKVLEAHGLYPEMITQRQQHSGKSYGHYMWLESNGQYKDDSFEGLDKYISCQFEQLSKECDLFNTTIPLHMIPPATFLKEIIDLINAVDVDDQVENDIWKHDNILSQIYELYNNSKKAALKASGDKVEYGKVHVQSQIYTPEWVVKFLVDNSLGKMYLEMYPDSEIKDNHKIIGDFTSASRDIKPLDEFKIIDPCVGSGNFLLYCFDLFYDMYLDQIENYGADYSKREVPQMIIEKNLHGIDLDERAVQLTKVGLFIKAKTKRNSVHIDHYNVVSASFRLPAFSEIGTMFNAQFFSKDFSELLSDAWKDLQQAHKFGSLLRIDEKFEEKKKELKKDLGDSQLSLFTYEKVAEFDLFANNFYEKLEESVSKYAIDDKKKYLADEAIVAITYLKIIIEKYDVVVSNPPYTDGAALGNEIHEFLEENYKRKYNCTSNLYSCFIKSNIEKVIENGYVGMVHPHTFMYIDAYKDVRNLILQRCNIELLVDYGLDRVNLFGPGILVDSVFYIMKVTTDIQEGLYVNITDNLQEKYKKNAVERCIEDIINKNSNARVSSRNQNDFRNIDGTPFAYLLSPVLQKHVENSPLEKFVKIAGGMTTGCNERFVRLWWEIIDETKWFNYMKGGPYCKWAGNEWARLNWSNDGEELRKNKRSILRNKDYYLHDGITYTGSGSKGTTFRIMPANSLFDAGGSCIFLTGQYDNIFYLIAFLNSRLSFYLIDCLNPTVNTQVGDLKRIPFIKPENKKEKIITEMSKKCIELKQEIDRNYFLNGAKKSPLIIDSNVKTSVHVVLTEEICNQTKILVKEQVIDLLILEQYQLDDTDVTRMTEKIGNCVASFPVYKIALLSFIEENELTQIELDVLSGIEIIDELKGEDEITKKLQNILFTKNNELEDFCRNNEINPITVWYIINSKKIIPQTRAKVVVFEWFILALKDLLSERRDGIISITSTDAPIVQLLEEYAYKNGITSAQLLQMEEFLGKKIRDFIEKDFFVELMNYTNVFMYLPKTPFIWHLSSGENSGFEAFTLIYKWNVDSLYKLKSSYISKRREKLEFRKTQISSINTAQAIEEKDLIDKQLKEIEIFTKKIDELIAEGYNPILDDGVGKNIAPLQDKKMLKADVLNANQLKKYLKAEW